MQDTMTSSLQICRLFVLGESHAPGLIRPAKSDTCLQCVVLTPFCPPASSAASGLAVLSLGVRLKSISLSEDDTDEFIGVLVFFQHQFSPGFEVFGIAAGAITASTALVMFVAFPLPWRRALQLIS